MARYALLALLLLSASCFSTRDAQEGEGTFRIASVYGTPIDLHPYSGLIFIEQKQIYDCLVWLDQRYTGDRRTRPDLIASYTASKDGKIFDFTIHDGTRFHNGTVMTADDVVYSIKRYLRSDSMRSRMSNWMPSMMVKKTGEYSVRLESGKPEDWLHFLTIPVLNAEYEAKFEKSGLKDYVPMGSGPYKFAGYDAEKRVMKLKAYNEFREGRPSIDNVEVHYFHDPEGAIMALFEYRLDYVMELSPEDAGYVVQNPAFTVFGTMEQYPMMIVLNAREPQLSDRRVRRALSLLVNKDDLIKKSFRGKEPGEPADAPLHMAEPVTRPVVYGSDVEKAMALFADAGWERKNGRLLKENKPLSLEILLTEYNSRYLLAVRRIVSIWEKAGVYVYFLDLGVEEWMKTVRAGDYTAVFTEFLDFSSLEKNAAIWGSGGGFNFSGLSDPVIDVLFEKVERGEGDLRDLKTMIQERIIEESPAITLFYQKSYGAFHNSFKINRSILGDPATLYYLARKGW